MPLYLQRTYNAFWSGIGIFGKYWLSNFDYSLSANTVNNVPTLWIQYPDGRRIKFLYNATAARYNEDKPQAIAWAVKNADGTYTVHNEARGIEIYRADGHIAELKNEQGIAWTFTYSGQYLQKVRHSSGREINFTWTNSLLTQVTDPAGNVYTYTYTPNIFGTGRGRLASTTLPGTPATTIAYHYEDSRFPSALTGKSFNNVRYSTYAYDAQGRAISTEHTGVVEKYQFAYAIGSSATMTPPPAPPPPGGYINEREQSWCDPSEWNCSINVVSPGDPETEAMALETDGTEATATTETVSIPTQLTVTVTNPLGKKTSYLYVNNKLTSVTGQASAHCPASYKESSYDANGYQNLVTDFEDGVVDYDFDAHGHLLKTVEASGTTSARTTTYTWDEAKNRLLTQTIAGINATTYGYDAEGRIASVAVKNLSTKGVANQTRTTTYTYTQHPSGLVSKIEVDGPLTNDTITSNFSTTGDLTSVVNGLGHTTTYGGYNGLGLPGYIISPNNDRIDITYDGRGRITTQKKTVNSVVQTTTYTYDGAGNLASVQRPDGQKRIYVYDAARRLIEEYEREAEGTYARKRSTLNAMSLPTKVEVLRSTFPYDTQIKGNIDGVGSDAKISGWACTTGQDAPINVHLYLGGPAGTGTMSGSYAANQPSEAAVAAACNAQGSAYRFTIALSDSVRELHGGKGIYIHGISPAGKTNLLINKSGTYTVPYLAPETAPTATAPATTDSDGAFTVSWTSVSGATSYQLQQSKDGASFGDIYNGAALSKAVSGLTNGTYAYRVRGCNPGGCGPFSATDSVVVSLAAPPATPVMTAPSGYYYGTTTYSAAWNAVSGATSYRLEEQVGTGSWGEIYNGANTSKSVSHGPGSYKYQVRACNAQGCSAYSTVKSVTVMPEEEPCGPGTGQVCP